MTREWKPGDVAMVTVPNRGDVIAMYMDGGEWETPWAEPDGRTTYSAAPTYSRGLVGRPLVVIDPEDRERVERLYRGWCDNLCGPDMDQQVAAFQAALREFANPTPETPQFHQRAYVRYRSPEGLSTAWADRTVTNPAHVTEHVYDRVTVEPMSPDEATALAEVLLKSLPGGDA